MFFDPGYIRSFQEQDDTASEHTFDSTPFSVFQYADMVQPVSTDTILFSAGNGTIDNPWLIETEAQLRAFAHSVNADNDYNDCYIALTNDIILTEKDWFPAGGGNYPFRGHFDGQNHCISSLKIGSASYPYYDLPGINAIGHFGLFSVLEEGAVISNLHLDVEFYIASDQSLYTAALAGYASHAHMENIQVSGTIQISTFHSTANVFAGGICARCYRQTIEHCSSSVKIQAETIDGMAEAGGITGFQNRGVISNCHANGTIIGKNASIEYGKSVLGGIAGVHAGTIINCSSLAAVLANTTKGYLGTLAGWATGISSTLESCYCIQEPSSDTSNTSTHLYSPYPLVEPIGMRVSSGKNNFGVSYAGSIVNNIYGFEQADAQEELLAFRNRIAI